MAKLTKKEKKIRSDLARYVRQRYNDALEYKRENYERLLTCHRQVRGEDISGCGELDPEIRIKMNITSPIVRGIVGLMRDVFANSIENPFVIKPTPIAELSDSQNAAVKSVLENVMQEIGPMMGGVDPKHLDDLGQQTVEATLHESNKQATAAAVKMSTKIQDDLKDANWLKEFGDFLYNFVVYPTAFIKAPVVEYVKYKRWNGDRMVVEDKLVRRVENVSPFDIYPAPHARDLNSAEYVIEKRKISKSEMFNLMHTDGFNVEGIADVLEEYPGGYLEPYEDSDHNAEIEEERDTSDGEEHDEAQGFYDTLGFYGAIRGDVLESFGIEVLESRKLYEAEIWMVGDYIIKAKLNPDIMGRRPFYAASFEPIPGSVWGESPVTRLTSIHQICHATVVALVRNMSYSSGIQGEVDPDRILSEDQDPREIIPNSITLVDGNASYNGQPAYRYYTPPDISPSLLNVLSAFQQQAYEIIGIPRVAFGSSDNLGSVGRTSGGVAMVLNQASKAVKFALRIVEESIIEPVVQDFIDYRLMYDDDPSIKGDIKVYARGVSGIVEKENKESKLEWVMQSLAPWVGQQDENGQMIVPPSAIRRLLVTLFESAGIETDDIFPNEELKSILGGGASLPPTANPLVDGAPLDARSGAAMQAIQGQAGVGSNPTGQPGQF